MASIYAAPGESADQAFRLGTLSAMGVASAGVVGCVWAGLLTPFGAFLTVALGFPVLYVLVACGLGVWLGYPKDAKARVLAASRHDRQRDREESQ